MESRSRRPLGTAAASVVMVGLLVSGCARPEAPGFGAPSASRSAPISSSSADMDESPTAGPLTSARPATTTSRHPTSGPPPAAALSTTVTTSEASTGPGRRPALGTIAHPIEVQVTGMVLIDAKGTTVMCPPFAIAAVGTAPDTPTPTPDCLDPVPLSGIDLTRLQSPGHNTTHRWGETHIEASWNGATLKVVAQREPDAKDEGPLPNGVDHLACTTPAGGWAVGPTQNDEAIGKIEAVVGSDFGGLAMGYPRGGPTNVDGNNPSYALTDTEQVVVVGVTGDIAAATRSIRTVFQGNLCVVHAAATAAVVQHQNAAILAALGPDLAKSGVIDVETGQPVLGTQSNDIQAVVDTARLEKVVSGLAGPPVTITPWIKPVT